MALLTISPSSINLGTLTYPASTGLQFTITNAYASAINLKSFASNSGYFSISSVGVLSTTIDVASSVTLTAYPIWVDRFFDGPLNKLYTFSVSGIGVSSLSSVTLGVSATFDGYDYPAQVPVAGEYDEEHQRLYNLGYI